MAFGGVMMYSDDGGETWTGPVPNPLRLPNGQQTAHHGSILAEGDELTIISASEAPPHGLTGWTGTPGCDGVTTWVGRGMSHSKFPWSGTHQKAR